MSVLSPAQLVLVLRGVIGEGAGATRKWFRDDNFINNWSRLQGDGSFTNDGDIAVLTNGTLNEVWKNTSLAAPTNTVPKIVFRSRRKTGTPTPTITVLYTDASFTNFSGSTSTSFVVNTATLDAAKTVNEIRLGNATAEVGAATEWDFVILCKDTPLDITKYVKSLSAEESLRGRSSASLVVNNDNARFWTSPNRINQSDMLLVWAKDDVSPATGFARNHKRFGGKITGLKQRAANTPTADKTLSITARGWGIGLEKTTISTTSQAEFFGLSDQTFVSKVIDKANGLGWNFAYLINNTIQDVLTTTVLDWIPERRSALQVLEALSDWLSARRDSTVDLPDGTPDRGCDFRVTPAEVFEWGVIDNFFPLDGTTRTQGNDFAVVDLEELTDHIVNAVFWIGTMFYPAGGDAFTEGDAANWSVQLGTATISDETSDFKTGAKSIKVDQTAGTTLRIRRALGITLDVTKIGNNQFPPSFRIWWKREATGWGASNAHVWLEAPNSTDKFVLLIDKPDASSWRKQSANLGPEYTSNGTVSRIDSWRVGTGSPVWTTIGAVQIEIDDAGGNNDLKVDGMAFVGTIVEVAYDNASINAHGRSETAIVDRTGRDVIEHRRLARGMLRRWRSPIFQGTLKFSGIYEARPGDRLDATIPDLNQTAKRYRILSVKHKLFPAPAETTIEVTDHMATLDAPRGKPALFQMLTGQGMQTKETFEGVDFKLSELIQGITRTETEIGAAI